MPLEIHPAMNTASDANNMADYMGEFHMYLTKVIFHDLQAKAKFQEKT